MPSGIHLRTTVAAGVGEGGGENPCFYEAYILVRVTNH